MLIQFFYTLRSAKLPVTVKEYLMLLEALMAHPGRILSKAQLQEKLYDWGESLESNTLEVHVHHLRRKLRPTLIQTVRGIGYAIARAASP